MKRDLVSHRLGNIWDTKQLNLSGLFNPAETVLIRWDLDQIQVHTVLVHWADGKKKKIKCDFICSSMNIVNISFNGWWIYFILIRLGRPYSPAMRDRQHLLLSPAPSTTGPTVESPVTPHNSSAPPSLSHALNNLKLEHAVSIEEVDCSSASGKVSWDDHSLIRVGESTWKLPFEPMVCNEEPI